jgi:hypothetical protein
MNKWRLLIILPVVLMVAVFFPAVALATDQPDSTPTAEFYVYRNLLETGDRLMLIYQNIPYTVVPDEPIGQTYMWRMLAADNVTELGTALSYSFNDNGYGWNLTSMYWDAGNVTSSGMAWNTSYTIRLSQVPVFFTAPVNYNFPLSTADYSTLTDSDAVETELGVNILTIAADLDIRWGLGATYSLLNETETGTVLSIYGEAFFRAAIYGLQGLCPTIFAYVIEDIDLESRTFTDTYVTTLENQYAGTWVDTAKTAGAALFGTGYDLTAMLFTILAAIAVAVAAIILSGDAWHGIADAKTVFIVATRLGFFDLGFLAVLASLAVIYGVTRMWGVVR